eukprot:CAMPEP_0115114764 /NCGR_PEP_ID=MMETSP0227-20121206/42265_1 /TAXON_ID=89957 /ORGANISM="Polarella glacialis, Strain CCMP 1383" /LENGTH=163 /DNA_ID=CAMNT_0002515255 /DNA_START=283 /DNA_END=771 /DNA_ORIENTATION=-
MACEAPACNNWHSPSEKRCRRFALVHKCEKEGCDDGLHVKAPDVSQVFVLDLTARSAVQEVRTLEASSATLRAQYIRIVVWGFCSVRSALLRKALQALPLVHELALPDREASAGVEMTIKRRLEELPQAPLRHLVVGRQRGALRCEERRLTWPGVVSCNFGVL